MTKLEAVAMFHGERCSVAEIAWFLRIAPTQVRMILRYGKWRPAKRVSLRERRERALTRMAVRL